MMNEDRKIFIGNIDGESFQGTPIELFEKAIELSKSDNFEVKTNNPQFLEALEVLCKEENLKVFLQLSEHECIPIHNIVTAYNYLGEIYEIIDCIRISNVLNEDGVDYDAIDKEIKNYKEKWSSNEERINRDYYD